MSDFLTRLAARTLEITPVLQPKLASLFSPVQTELGEAPSGMSEFVISDTTPIRSETLLDTSSSSSPTPSPPSARLVPQQTPSAHPPLPLTGLPRQPISAPTSMPPARSLAQPEEPPMPQVGPSAPLISQDVLAAMLSAIAQQPRRSLFPLPDPSSTVVPPTNGLINLPSGSSISSTPPHSLSPSPHPPISSSFPAIPAQQILPKRSRPPELPQQVLSAEPAEINGDRTVPSPPNFSPGLLPLNPPLPEIPQSLVQPNLTPHFPLPIPTPHSPPPTPPPPTIQVTIGRIEVRVAPPTALPKRSKSTQAVPALSLQDYLKQRQGGQS